MNKIVAPPPAKIKSFVKIEETEAPDGMEAAGSVSGEGADVASFVGTVGWPPIAGTMNAREGLANPPMPAATKHQNFVAAIDDIWPDGMPPLLRTARNKKIRDWLVEHNCPVPDTEDAFNRAVERALTEIRARYP